MGEAIFNTNENRYTEHYVAQEPVKFSQVIDDRGPRLISALNQNFRTIKRPSNSIFTRESRRYAIEIRINPIRRERRDRTIWTARQNKQLRNRVVLLSMEKIVKYSARNYYDTSIHRCDVYTNFYHANTRCLSINIDITASFVKMRSRARSTLTFQSRLFFANRFFFFWSYIVHFERSAFVHTYATSTKVGS